MSAGRIALTLYYVSADDVDGNNRDLFVNADSPGEAADLVIAYWAEDGIEINLDDVDAVNVFQVPQPGPTGAVPWRDVVSHYGVR